MRLLNVSTRILEELNGYQKHYAILSHTWGEEEVTFEDLKTGDYTSKLGYNKIDGCCKQALKDRIEYIWIDTCCIDKSSSAELSEAINSMFHWYKNSRCCYIYLADVPPASLDDHKRPGSAFRSSRWFTRGWTLQELLAPRKRKIFDTSWQQIDFDGEKRESITHRRRRKFYGSPEEVDLLSEITDIPREYLEHNPLELFPVHRSLNEASISERMSWASRRETTRKEDMAYCLLGIFGVNMPLLYGEGEGSFLRLQEEILRVTPDETIFCWGFDGTDQESRDRPIGALARSPRQFAKIGYLQYGRKVNTTSRGNKWSDRRYEAAGRLASHSTVTNQGILIELPLHFIDDSNGLALGILDVYVGHLDQRVALPLVRGNALYSNVFVPAPGCSPFILPKNYEAPSPATIYLQHRVTTDWKISANLLDDHLLACEFILKGDLWKAESWRCQGWYPPIPVTAGRSVRLTATPPQFLMVYANQTSSILCLLETGVCLATWTMNLRLAAVSEHISTPLDVLYDEASQKVASSRLERFDWIKLSGNMPPLSRFAPDVGSTELDSGTVRVGNRTIYGRVSRTLGDTMFTVQLGLLPEGRSG